MDWTVIYIPATAILNALILGFWKPWGRAYAAEKGKNLARKEDLDAILAEVRAVTVAQKQIEQKLTGDLWDHQMRWNERKQIYADLLKSAHRMSTKCALLPTIIGMQNEQRSETSRLHLQTQFAATVKETADAQADLQRAFALDAICNS